MSLDNPLTTVFGLALILLGLTYPFVILWRLNRQLSGKEAPANRQLAITIAMTALVPLTAVLAGFWLLAPAARQSLLCTGVLFGSAMALVVVALIGYRVNRPS